MGSDDKVPLVCCGRLGGDFLNHLKKSDQPIICVDLAIPRDFADAFNYNDAVTLIDIHVLKSHVQGNLRQKFIEAGKADEIVRTSVNKFMSDRIEVSLMPVFQDSYQESIELAREAIDDLFANRKSNLPIEEKERVMRLVTRLVGHSAFQPARVRLQSDQPLQWLWPTADGRSLRL